MRILKENASAETMAKNSRFLSELTAVKTPEEARAVWHSKKETYDNGGHIVFAFITGPQGNIQGCSDDGEPSGTAGRPTLEVLKGSGLTNVILTTARWFGGTLLGTGGLVRAYTAGAQAVLANAKIVELVPVCKISFRTPYGSYESVKRLLTEFHVEIQNEDFGVDVGISGTMETAYLPVLENRLRDLSSGKIHLNHTKNLS